MYKQYTDEKGKVAKYAIIRIADSVCIPFSTDNTDYQNFKTEVTNGAELQDAEGNVMTQEEADAFIATLP